MNTQKTPKIAADSTILCFDVEANGLHGQGFAIGAVLVSMQGKVVDQFRARCPIDGPLDPWVKEHVLPSIEDIPQTHKTYQDMCQAFWRWFVPAHERADYTLVANGYPVEYRLLLDCQGADIEANYWDHPFPLIDVSSLLLGADKLDPESKGQLASVVGKKASLKAHHPVDDALASALTAVEVLGRRI